MHLFSARELRQFLCYTGKTSVEGSKWMPSGDNLILTTETEHYLINNKHITILLKFTKGWTIVSVQFFQAGFLPTSGGSRLFFFHMFNISMCWGIDSLCIILLFPPVFALPEYFVAIAHPSCSEMKCSIPKVHVILNTI